MSNNRNFIITPKSKDSFAVFTATSPNSTSTTETEQVVTLSAEGCEDVTIKLHMDSTSRSVTSCKLSDSSNPTIVYGQISANGGSVIPTTTDSVDWVLTYNDGSTSTVSTTHGKYEPIRYQTGFNGFNEETGQIFASMNNTTMSRTIAIVSTTYDSPYPDLCESKTISGYCSQNGQSYVPPTLTAVTLASTPTMSYSNIDSDGGSSTPTTTPSVTWILYYSDGSTSTTTSNHGIYTLVDSETGYVSIVVTTGQISASSNSSYDERLIATVSTTYDSPYPSLCDSKTISGTCSQNGQTYVPPTLTAVTLASTPTLRYDYISSDGGTVEPIVDTSVTWNLYYSDGSTSTTTTNRDDFYILDSDKKTGFASYTASTGAVSATSNSSESSREICTIHTSYPSPYPDLASSKDISYTINQYGVYIPPSTEFDLDIWSNYPGTAYATWGGVEHSTSLSSSGFGWFSRIPKGTEVTNIHRDSYTTTDTVQYMTASPTSLTWKSNETSKSQGVTVTTYQRKDTSYYTTTATSSVTMTEEKRVTLNLSYDRTVTGTPEETSGKYKSISCDNSSFSLSTTFTSNKTFSVTSPSSESTSERIGTVTITSTSVGDSCTVSLTMDAKQAPTTYTLTAYTNKNKPIYLNGVSHTVSQDGDRYKCTKEYEAGTTVTARTEDYSDNATVKSTTAYTAYTLSVTPDSLSWTSGQTSSQKFDVTATQTPKTGRTLTIVSYSGSSDSVTVNSNTSVTVNYTSGSSETTDELTGNTTNTTASIDGGSPFSANKTSVTGSGTVSVTPPDATTDTQTGTITVSIDEDNKKTVSLSKAARGSVTYYRLACRSADINTESGPKTATADSVTVNSDDTSYEIYVSNYSKTEGTDSWGDNLNTWSFSKSGSWITSVAKKEENSNGKGTYALVSFSKNTSTSNRNGTVTFSYGGLTIDVPITQNKKEETYVYKLTSQGTSTETNGTTSATASSIMVGSGATSVTIDASSYSKVSTSTDWGSDNDDWSVSKSSGSWVSNVSKDNKQALVTFDGDNTKNTTPRSGSIEFTYQGLSVTVPFTQAAGTGETKQVMVIYYSESPSTIYTSYTLNYDATKTLSQMNAIPSDPTKSGYTFKGWTKGGSIVDPNTVDWSAGASFYAEWEELPQNVIITYKYNYTLSPSEPYTSYTKTKSSSTIGAMGAYPQSSPTRSGYVFQGWATSSTGAVVTPGNYDCSTDRTFYAKWEKIATVSVKISSIGSWPTSSSLKFNVTYINDKEESTTTEISWYSYSHTTRTLTVKKGTEVSFSMVSQKPLDLDAVLPDDTIVDSDTTLYVSVSQ